MWQSYLNGLLVAIGLIMAIGTQNAFVLAQSLRREHHLPVAALSRFRFYAASMICGTKRDRLRVIRPGSSRRPRPAA